MKAFLKNYRQAPRKVRLVADSIKGKSVPQALAALQFMPKRAADPMAKLVKSAVANALDRDQTLSVDTLVIENATVDKGITFMRFMPRARGRASKIRKETSHVLISLAEKPSVKTEKSKTKKATVSDEATSQSADK